MKAIEQYISRYFPAAPSSFKLYKMVLTIESVDENVTNTFLHWFFSTVCNKKFDIFSF